MLGCRNQASPLQPNPRAVIGSRPSVSLRRPLNKTRQLWQQPAARSWGQLAAASSQQRAPAAATTALRTPRQPRVASALPTRLEPPSTVRFIGIHCYHIPRAARPCCVETIDSDARDRIDSSSCGISSAFPLVSPAPRPRSLSRSCAHPRPSKLRSSIRGGIRDTRPRTSTTSRELCCLQGTCTAHAGHTRTTATAPLLCSGSCSPSPSRPTFPIPLRRRP